jgi:hemerythrin-like domain-containing protein
MECFVVLPVERLTSEHRLIEQMVSLLQKETESIVATGKVSPEFIGAAVDFFRTYADRYHHGKEEGILFKELSNKRLSSTDHNMILELVNEHALARRTVRALERLKEEYVTGVKETPKDVLELLDALVNLYPEHIRKEDTQFFLPSMNYFTQEEQEDMLDRFLEFDKDFTNKRYEKTIEALKERIAQK